MKQMKNFSKIFVLIMAFAWSGTLWAQGEPPLPPSIERFPTTPPPPPPPPVRIIRFTDPRPMDNPMDPFGAHFYPPEMVMQYQKKINLSKKQRDYIIKETTVAQHSFTGLQWDLQEAMEEMHVLLKNSSVEESKVKTQLDKILDLEKKIKHQQVGLMVKVKNKLTKDQQKILQNMK